MARPLRLEYPGALYHVTSRGNVQDEIYLCDEDRDQFIDLLRDEVVQQGWICYAWCLMDNHYHFLVETPESNLSRGMQRLNGRYTQAFNRRHGRVGHVFQGRYKGILVEKESHLLELCRYIVLNPVRAGMVSEVGDWAWSSYHSVIYNEDNDWLAAHLLLSLFASQRDEALSRYIRFVQEAVGAVCPWDQLRGQVYLGGDEFLAASRAKVERLSLARDIPLKQQHPERPDPATVLSDVADAYGVKVDGLFDRRLNQEAYQTAVFLLRRACNLSLKRVADLAGVSIGRVSQIQSSMAGKRVMEELNKYKV